MILRNLDRFSEEKMSAILSLAEAFRHRVETHGGDAVVLPQQQLI